MDATPAASRRVTLVVILGVLSAFGPLSVDFYLPGLPKLTSDFGAGASAGQGTLTASIVGLALGQLVVGPISDRMGRRPPLLAGLVLYCVASIACAVSPSIWVLIALRLVQGLAGAAGIVVARSVVRDLASGTAAAQFYSVIMVVLGVVPIAAPVLGGELLRVTSWRGLFVILAAVAGLILLATLLWLPETLPRDRRTGAQTVGFRELLRDRVFLAWSVALGLSYGALFGYIAGSSFVLQDIYGVSPPVYGLIFGMNALGLVTCSQLNRPAVRRWGPARVLLGAVAAQGVAGVTLLALVLAGGVGLGGVLPCLFVTVSMLGIVAPNGTALAITDYPHAAGRASALIGAAQFLVGGACAPLVGLAGRSSAVPMAVSIAVFGVGAFASALVARRVLAYRLMSTA